MTDSAETSPTLIGRLRCQPPDQAAWKDFERRYGEMIQRWCKRWGLQSSDADDLAQDVLLALSKQMEGFEYDPQKRFRSWLKTIAYRTWVDFLEKQKRRAVGSGETAILKLLDSEEAKDDFFAELENEWKRELLEQAMERVRGRVQAHTWEAFRMLTQDGLSGQAVADQLDMKVGAVWVVKSKVQKMIQQEIRKLESMEPGAR